MTSATNFPLERPPKCITCGNQDTKLADESFSNLSGNYGRPYYHCPQCRESGQRDFVCFNDDLAIVDVECECGSFSRLSIAGPYKKYPGCLFRTCASGQCDPFEYIPIDIDWKDVFEPVSLEIWENHIAVRERLGTGHILKLNDIQEIRLQDKRERTLNA